MIQVFSFIDKNQRVKIKKTNKVYGRPPLMLDYLTR